MDGIECAKLRMATRRSGTWTEVSGERFDDNNVLG